MIDSIELYECYTKRVKLTTNDDYEFTGVVDFYESEYDSGSGVAEIGLNNVSTIFRADEIKSIEILD
ncbi:hypothetical protein [Ruminococcus albus]|uniref:hypothetical protein n=1 Tax=Ruminococcus albus TaxID=1264 RepID=UPI000463DFBD|nr:hypothetical protein [Ruminococcus albus]